MKSNSPNDPPHVKFNVEDMAGMAVLKLPHHLSCVQVPKLYRGVVASTNKPSARRIEGKRTDKEVVSCQRSQTFAFGRRPDFDLAIVGT